MSMNLLSISRFTSLIGLVFACLTLSVFPASAQNASIPTEDFFANPSLSHVKLSPNGKNVAMLIATKLGRVQLATMSLEEKKPKVVAGFRDGDVSQFHWVNDERLVFNVADHRVAIGANPFAQGLYAVNRDGAEFKQLVERVWGEAFSTGTTIKRRVLNASVFFYALDYRKNSDQVFVAEPIYDNLYELTGLCLLLLNTKTGMTEAFSGPGNTREWLIDRDGTPRVSVSVDSGKKKVFYRAAIDEQWRQVLETGLYRNTAFVPFEFGPDGVLYVLANQGKDTSSLYRFDLTKNSVEAEPIVSVSGYDFSGSLIFDYTKNVLLGVRYLNDASSTHWLDAEMKALQTKVDEKLPSTINDIQIGREGLARHVIVRAYSDTQSPVFLSFDRETEKLEMLGAAFPKIDASKMAMQDMVRYPAKDGLMIPAYLTLPKGEQKKNLPLIVLVHGGPYVRGSNWRWDAEVQFLASRGYAVIQPEFRGSTGFGFKHFRAGWKQWGLAMQDDIAEAARWAIKSGIADPKRICIAGASYGGYATLMGLAKDPDLYKCGIAWAAVTDISLMYRSTWSHDLSAEWQTYGMPTLIGDPEKDAEAIRLNSPVNQVEYIKQPLLLAHGGSDRRVPLEHGENFLKAIRDRNAQVEWLIYPDEGHGWGLVSTRVDFWNKVDKFLEAQLGKN